MILNRAEKIFMNNPLRAAIHRHVEARALTALGGRMQTASRALEVGCGNGTGARIILDVFGAERLDAFDLDPDMVRRATRKLARYGTRARIFQGDVCHIDAPNNHYDAVFDFGIIHHVPVWRDALDEVFRVLKPGGRFYVDEIYATAVDHPLMRFFTDHPKEDRFDHATFNIALQNAGFTLIRSLSCYWFGWHVADKLTVD